MVDIIFRDKLEEKIYLLYPFTEVCFREHIGSFEIVIRYFIYGEMRGFIETISTELFNHDTEYRKYIFDAIINEFHKDIVEQTLRKGGRQ